MKSVVPLCVVCLLVGGLGVSGAADSFKSAAGPTPENALAAEHELTGALLANDADAVGRILADDWTVISTHGGVADRASFLAVIKSGDFARKTLDVSDAKVRLYGDVAVVTAQVKTSGTFGGKSFDVTERETDVLVWRDGGWKAVLSHETEIRPT